MLDRLAIGEAFLLEFSPAGSFLDWLGPASVPSFFSSAIAPADKWRA
ncbi:hypothetical protein [Amycolatopsis anabasis]|nr:hypothetical protein [Amycolatopsis anabasis]